MEKTLGARLVAVAEAIPECESLVDVGCDHGYVAIYAAKTKKARRITATDINRGPLMNAEREIEKNLLSGLIETRLTDGLSGICPHDCVVIAGMGGETIIDIIKDVEWVRSSSCTLVLQPMTKPELLRGYLYDEGFVITSETFVKESGHLYSVIKAEYCGKACDIQPFEKYISRAGLEDNGAAEYADKVIRRLSYEAESRDKAGVLTDDEKKRILNNIKSLCEVREKL